MMHARYNLHQKKSMLSCLYDHSIVNLLTGYHSQSKSTYLNIQQPMYIATMKFLILRCLKFNNMSELMFISFISLLAKSSQYNIWLKIASSLKILAIISKFSQGACPQTLANHAGCHKTLLYKKTSRLHQLNYIQFYHEDYVQ